MRWGCVPAGSADCATRSTRIAAGIASWWEPSSGTAGAPVISGAIVSRRPAVCETSDAAALDGTDGSPAAREVSPASGSVERSSGRRGGETRADSIARSATGASTEGVETGSSDQSAARSGVSLTALAPAIGKALADRPSASTSAGRPTRCTSAGLSVRCASAGVSARSMSTGRSESGGLDGRRGSGTSAARSGGCTIGCSVPCTFVFEDRRAPTSAGSCAAGPDARSTSAAPSTSSPVRAFK